MGELERPDGNSEISWPVALMTGTGFGLAATFAHLGLLAPMIVAAVVPLVFLFVARPRFFSLSDSGYDSAESRPGDLPAWRYWSPFIPPAVTFLAGYALDPLPVGPVAGGTVYAVTAILSFTWSLRHLGTQNRVIGHRRARKVLETVGIDDLTPARPDAAETHRGLMVTMLGIGAVDGQRVRLWKLGEATGADPGRLLPAVRELRRHGLVGISTIDAGDDVGRQLVDLTSTGVRALAEVGGR